MTEEGYSLPKRVGAAKAREITDLCLPMGTRVAKEIGLIDDCFSNDYVSFGEQVRAEAEKLARNINYRRDLLPTLNQRLQRGLLNSH